MDPNPEWKIIYKTGKNKHELAEKYNNDRKTYTEGKTEFIKQEIENTLTKLKE